MTGYRKFIAALAGAAALAVSEGLVPDTVERWITVAIGFLTALGVYAIPNGGAPALDEHKPKHLKP